MTALALGVGIIVLGWGLRLSLTEPSSALGDPELARPGQIAIEHYTFLGPEIAVPHQTQEPPLLEPLVVSDRLPSLSERLPQNPLVIVGVGNEPGSYGGTMLRAATSPFDIQIVHRWRMSYAAPVRWSPMGEPIVPHVAESLTSDDGGRTWTFRLREGHRWSDGAPFTADDVLYWWEAEVLNTAVGAGTAPYWILNGGEVPTITKLSDTVFTVAYATPHNLFREMMASFGFEMFDSPRHVLSRYHPTLGEPEFLDREMKAYALNSRRALYGHIRSPMNPQVPRLWPWVYTSHRGDPPQVFVRNPYYFAVDAAGRQLPYVDRVQYDVRRQDLIPLDAASGRLSMQTRHLRFADWTEYATRANEGTLSLRAWRNASASDFVIYPNLNRRAEADDPVSTQKATLLGDADFRRALSMAIDREEIVIGEYKGLTRPSQVAPGEGSPYHDESLAQRFAVFDPARAETMLDELGLHRPNPDAMRTLPDGTPMVWYIDYSPFTGRGPIDFVVDHWRRVGVRAVARERSRQLFAINTRSRVSDFMVWTAESDFLPLVSPRNFVPYGPGSYFARGWANWHAMGGHGGLELKSGQAFAPPADSPAMQTMDLYAQARGAASPKRRIELFRQMWEIAAEQVWSINLTTAPPLPVVVDPDLRNVPDRVLAGYIFCTPGNAGLETWYFTTKRDSPGALEQARQSLVAPDPMPRPGEGWALTAEGEGGSGIGKLVASAVAAAAILSVLLLGLRHPFIGRRLLIMAPTLAVLSVLIFAVIQAPPGDYLTARLAELEEAGGEGALEQIEDLRQTFHFDEPIWKQYLRWSGLWWFTSFDSTDRGLLQGDLGRSMQSGQPVSLILGDRLWLTMAISAGTILFTWVIALPIGIYSAVRQYSVGDYAATVVGFVGMAVPNFLLALVLMTVAGVSGLFSAEYATQPEWTWGKFLDLLGHVWVPVVVLGTGGTAAMIRIMRANLLDELSRPYVTVARAKGVRPLKLLLKYPVRLAINPFVSGIGNLLPQLVSGGAIVAIVLSLPTIGPLLLESLFLQDMYLAGSLLMIMSLLGIVGTLLSDLLLMLVDPRIRMGGGGR